MARKKFSQLAPIDKYKRLNRQSTTAKAMGMFSVVAPVATVVGINFKDYFVYNDAGWSVSIGCILAIIVGLFGVISENKENAKHYPSSIKWLIAFAILFLINSIVTELVLIVGVEAAGQLSANVCTEYSKGQKEKAILYRNAMIQAESMGKDTKEI